MDLNTILLIIAITLTLVNLYIVHFLIPKK